MGIKVWNLIATLFLVSVNGEVRDNDSQRFYGKQESSSPAPPSTQSPGQLVGMKEFVLYLTPEQVQALQASGAIVRPFPQFEKAYQQQQYQQSVEENTELQYQPATTSEDLKEDSELDEFYKVLNIQQINEDLALQAQSGEQSTEKSRPKYIKYTPKPKQQDYAALYVQKKANRGKGYSTEYVRYLPNYEIEDLKMLPYRSQPLPGYRFENPQNLEFQSYLQNEATAIQKNEDIQKPEQIQIQKFDVSTRSREQGQQQLEPPVQKQSTKENKGPVTFEEKLRESSKAWGSIKVQGSTKSWESTNIWEPAKVYESEEKQTPLAIQRFSEVQSPVKAGLLGGEQEERRNIAPTEPNSGVIHRQFSSLLAPLIQHEKITESIAQQKEELINSELAIQSKLKEIQESDNHDEEKYAIELDKLNRNLGKQNALAQKLVLESISKTSQPRISVKAEDSFERRQPTGSLEQDKVSEPSPVSVDVPESLELGARRPYTGRLGNARPIPVPVLQPKEVSARKPVANDDEKRGPLPITRNVYVKVDHPYLVQKVVEVKHEFPVKHPIHRPDELVIRPLWEH